MYIYIYVYRELYKIIERAHITHIKLFFVHCKNQIFTKLALNIALFPIYSE